MRHKLLSYLLPLLLLITASCNLRVPTAADLPSWFVTLHIPLVNQTATGKDLIPQDSLLTTEPIGTSGDSLYVFQDTYPLDTVRVGNRLKIDDINQTFTQKVDDIIIGGTEKQEQIGFDSVTIADVNQSAGSTVGPIELTDTNPMNSETFTFREIMPQDLIQSMESTLQDSGGSATFPSIPGRDLASTEKPHHFDTFQYGLLTSGYLDITLVNNMFLPLGSPVHLSLRDSNGVEFASTTFSDPIPPHSSATKTIDLSGDSLGSDIILHVEGHSNGSSSSVHIQNSDLDSGFHFVIQARDMVATETNAQIPSQTVTRSDTMTLTESDNRIETASLRSGTLSLDFANYLNLASEVYLRIPSLEDVDGTTFERGPILLAAQSNVHRDYSLEGTTLQMDTSNQSVRYEYDVHTVDTGSEFRTVNENDSIGVDVGMNNISLATVTGVIEQKTTTQDGDISLASDNEIISAIVESGEIVLNINNRVGGHPHLHLLFHQIYTSPGSNENLQRDIDLSESNNTPIVIPLNNTEIRMPRDDQTIYYTSVTTVGGQYATYDMDGMLDVNVDISQIKLAEATGYFTQDAMVVVDSIALNNATKLEEAVIDSGQLFLTIRNHVGIDGAVRLKLNEFTSNGVPLDTTIFIPETDQPVVRTIPLRDYKIQMALDDQSVHYTSRLRLLRNELMTLTFDDSVVVDVDINNLTFTRIEGEIEPVEVPIAPVEREFNALPDNLGGVKFQHVNMGIQFNTDIGVPVFLSLSLKAYNSQGDSAISTIDHWDITDSGTVRIPNAEDLINILPNRIVASGQATAGAPGVVGVLESDQALFSTLQISVPLQFELTSDAEISPNQQLVRADGVQDVESVVIYTQIQNQFEVGADFKLFGAKDSTYFSDSTLTTSLASLQIPPKSTIDDSIVVPSNKLDLFADSLYVKPNIRLLALTDAAGNPQPTSILSTDSLHMNLYAKIRYLNKPGDSGNNN